MTTLSTVADFIASNTPLRKTDSILIAVSGGPDSQVLLSILAKLGFTKMIAAHVNYKIRGHDSDSDEKQARDWAQILGIPFFRKTLIISKDQGNFQNLARQKRYAWFDSLAEQNQIKYILTGHHHDDQIETISMRFFNGSRGHGLQGILPINENRVRPLLCLRKKEILEYARSNKVPYRLDKSNTENHYLRNYFRNHLLPLLETKIPYLKNRVETTRNNIQREQRLLKQLCISHFVTWGYGLGELLIIPTEPLPNKVDQENLLWFLCHINKNEAQQITSSSTQKVFHFAPFRIASSKKYLFFEKKEHPIFFSETLKNPDFQNGISLQLPHGHLRASKSSHFEKNAEPTVEYIPSNCLVGSFRIESWKAGDRIEIHKGQHKKVSDLLNEQQLSPLEKEKVCCLWTESTLVWVIGIRLSVAAYAQDADRSFIKWVFQAPDKRSLTEQEVETIFFRE